MSFNRVVLKVAQENPEFRQALQEELSRTAAKRRHKPKKPAKKGPPPKSVIKLAEILLKKSGNKPYEYIEEMAKDDGKFELKEHAFGEFLSWSQRDINELVLNKMSKGIENATNRRAIEPVTVDPDELSVTADFNEGTISIRGKIWGTTISDPDKDIEAPKDQDLVDQELSDALKALGAKKYNVRYVLDDDPRYDDITEVNYKISAEWEFDPSLLALKAMDPSKVKGAVARGLAKHEP